MKIQKVAVICSDRISDGLMMMVASHRLYQEGCEVTTFHDHLDELSPWFENHFFAKRPKTIKELEKFDLIIAQYDSTPLLKELIKYARNRLSIFYPFYAKVTHPTLSPLDRIFNKHIPMVDNVALAIASLLNLHDHSKNNGLLAPKSLLHRKYKRRVAIYPSKWSMAKYEKIALEVKKYGFDALMIESTDLSLGASLIYESGYFIGPESDLCHLASNLQVPTIVVSGNKKPLMLLKPGWLRSSFITPPKWIPKAREHFIFTRKVISAFKRLAAKDLIQA